MEEIAFSLPYGKVSHLNLSEIVTSDGSRRLSIKTMFLWKALSFFALFSRGKGDYIDVWMITIISKQIKSKCMFASLKSR